MATNTIELTGIIEWAKLFESNRDNGEYDIETDGATTVDLIMDDETYQAMKDAGVRKQGKPDQEGRGTKVKFKRAWKDKYDRSWADGAPSVFKPDGTVWDLDTDGLIGNGSMGVVFLDVYDTKMGKGCRLSGVQVIDHIQYDSGGGATTFGPRPRNYTADDPTPNPTMATRAAMEESIPF